MCSIPAPPPAGPENCSTANAPLREFPGVYSLPRDTALCPHCQLSAADCRGLYCRTKSYWRGSFFLFQLSLPVRKMVLQKPVVLVSAGVKMSHPLLHLSQHSPGLPWLLAGPSCTPQHPHSHLPELHAQPETEASCHKRRLRSAGVLSSYCRSTSG